MFTRERKAAIVLKALYSGYEVELVGGHRKFVLCRSQDKDQPRLAIKATKTIVGKPGEETVYLSSDMSFDWFLECCEKMTNEEITILGANAALNDIIRKVPR